MNSEQDNTGEECELPIDECKSDDPCIVCNHKYCNCERDDSPYLSVNKYGYRV